MLVETDPVLQMGAKEKKVIVGVCAMERKARSKPIVNIIIKILDFYQEWLEILIFPEETITNEPIEKWPHCDCLIGFQSADFPLEKAKQYAILRKPYVINSLSRQFNLQDRIKVYETLKKAGIPVPRYSVLTRNKNGQEEGTLVEQVDHIVVNGIILHKPFVEKPVSAEDHNISIYYPSAAGGGSQRLFRKINNRSSQYDSNSDIRRDGSYLYEEFIPCDGTDVKVYAVGPYYAHAQARKSPALDGKVERDSEGKEVRYPVILTNKEKMIARKVVLAFGQTVCGFDLLRTKGESYVCDVNGFSFVKTSTKYYEDTAKILGNMILRRLAGQLKIPWKRPFLAEEDPPIVPTSGGKLMELRCVLAVIRHGDRTPKQKMKMTVTDKRFFDLFQKYGGKKQLEIKMKRPSQLKEVLKLARQILSELKEMQDENCSHPTFFLSGRKDSATESKIRESIKQWDQVRAVLEMYGYFSGINRKIQLKSCPPNRNSRHDVDISEQPSLLLILKWGGELTTAGVMQAEALGKLFRTLYSGVDEDKHGLGFLRLHSTYRHDLKIYASDEGRVQMTAAAFTKGLLALEGELPPVLVQMVKSANTDGLLDDDANARKFQDEVKKFVHLLLQTDKDLTQEDMQQLNPLGRKSIRDALEFIKNPRKMCEEIYEHIGQLNSLIRELIFVYKPETNLYSNETWELAERRWTKLIHDFRRVRKNGDVFFDISLIPDIYDNIKYDMEHNPHLSFHHENEFERLYMCAKSMADVIVPQEYGIRKTDKLSIAQGICTPLMNKIKMDIQTCIEGTEDDENLTRLDPRASQGIATPMRHVRTRLYFTSESHIHSLMNLIQYGGLIVDPNDRKWQEAMNFLSRVTEFNYMTQMVLMLYEDTTSAAEAEEQKSPQGTNTRFHFELLFSPGLYPCFQTQKERIYERMLYKRRHKSADSSDSDSNGENSNDRVDLQVGIKARTDTVSEGVDQRETTVRIVALGHVEQTKPFSGSAEDGSTTPNRRKFGTTISPQLSLLPIDVEELPYRFKHHTVNLLKDIKVTDRLISTAVIKRKDRSQDGDSQLQSPAVLSTAVIAHSSSAPLLQTFTADGQAMSKIQRFWPPLRSLETLHDNISFKQLDDFLHQVTTIRTPVPSPPPRTPTLEEGKECKWPNATNNQNDVEQKLHDAVIQLKNLGST